MAYGKLIKFAERNPTARFQLLEGQYYEAWMTYIREAPYSSEDIMNDIDAEISTKRGQKLLTPAEQESLQYEALDYHNKRLYETEEELAEAKIAFLEEEEFWIDKKKVSKAIKEHQAEKKALTSKNVKEEKLIKQGIKYTDSLFDEVKNRLTKDISKYNSLEEYLAAHEEYLIQNPLKTTGYDAVMSRLIAQSVTNVKFSRHAQRKLVQVTVENTVGDLIANVGEDIKASVRDIVKTGFEERKAPSDIAKDIETKIDSINNTRAKAIARTEVKRANTISNYIIANERGATAYYVDCHPEACPLCVEYFGEGENAPGDDKGYDNIYPIDDTEHLPPVHPNCRCSATFVKAEPNID